MQAFCYGPDTIALVRLGEVTVIPGLHKMEERVGEIADAVGVPP